MLTASTSEAYSLLFKLLCDPGDECWCRDRAIRCSISSPASTASRHALRARIPWRYGRSISASIERAVDRRTRARARRQSRTIRPGRVVSPPMPIDGWRRCARRATIALIVDEVFADYPLERSAGGAARACSRADVLAVRPRRIVEVGGAAAGQARLDCGRPARTGWCAEALERLELICDTYLSVSTPVQLAARTLLDSGRAVRDADPRPRPANYGRCQGGGGRPARGRACSSRRRLVRGSGCPPRDREEDLVARSAGARRGGGASRLFLRLSARGLSDREPSAGAGDLRRPPSSGCSTVSNAAHDCFHRHVMPGLLVPLFACPSAAELGHRRDCRHLRCSARGWPPPGATFCSCCRSTRWPTGRTRPIPRSARWRSTRSSSPCRACPNSRRSAARTLLDDATRRARRRRARRRRIDYAAIRALKTSAFRAGVSSISRATNGAATPRGPAV